MHTDQPDVRTSTDTVSRKCPFADETDRTWAVETMLTELGL